jgi:hypothetical protein
VQIDKPGSGRARQYRGLIVGLYPIVSSRGLNDRVVDLDEFLYIAGAVIFVNVPSLELLWPDELPERCSQGKKTAPH